MSLAGIDSIGKVGQALSPIGTNIAGVDPSGTQTILGVLILMSLGAFLAMRNAGSGIMAVVLFPAIILLYRYGLLPESLAIIAAFIGLAIIAFAFIRAKQG